MKSPEHLEEEQASAPSRIVVGVGASAGGLESIEKLFRALPSKTGLAFVVVQHLSPDYKSLMDELMSRYTALEVVRAADDLVVEPDHVYLLPPGKEIELRQGRLVLFDKVPRTGLSFPVDRFLASLAEDAGRNAVAIILSGSGTDGSRGARRVHEAGGMVLVEEPASARFDGMPVAALEAGVVDIVLPADALGRALMEHQTNAENDEATDVVEPSLKVLRHLFGVDFTEYKRSTVLRRMQRRLALRQIDDLDTYNALVAADRTEAQALCHDLLIGVTTFFRDVSCFERLERELFPRLVSEAAAEEREVRLWVAGCASGEEAYSMAILLDEAIEADGRNVRGRVFATDVHGEALEFAGQGAYPQDRVKNVGAERLERYFTARRDGTWQVVQSLRQRVVFARHNVLRDAPFTNLDLVSCRNMLIYFKPKAQRRTLALLHYGLRVGGVLMLGSSESTGELSGDFETVDEHARLYLKRQHTRLPSDLYLAIRTDRSAPAREVSRVPVGETPSIPLYDAVLDRFMPPSFLLGEGRALIDCFSGAEELLRLNPRRPSTDILDLVPESVRVPLSGALARSARDPAPVRFNGIDWPVGDKVRRYDVCVERVTPRGRRGHAYVVRLLSGQPVVDTPTEPIAFEELSRERFDGMEHELRQTRENLQSTIEQLETSNEELQATNEELVASNEELQSTNEELHSVNEELHTVNAEYQSKFNELKELNRDIRHLFEASDVATVFLDNELRIRKFTPRAASLFSLLPHDVGRRFASFNVPLQYPNLVADLEAVRTGDRLEREVRDSEGRCYLARLLPYGDGEEVTGVVLTLVDITVLTVARQRLELLSAIVDSSEDAIIGLDLDGKINAWNRGAARMYGWEAEEILGSKIHCLIPEDRRSEHDEVLERVLDEQRVENQWTQRLHRNGEKLDVSVSVSAVRDPDGEIVGVSKIDRDIRERTRLERQLRENERKFEDLYHNSPDMYLSIDARTGRVLECNATWLSTTGFTLEEAADLHITDLYTEDCQDRARKAFETFRRTGMLRDVELVMRCKNGTRVDVSLNETAVRAEDGQILRSRSVLRDITTRKRAEHLILDAARVREQFLAMVSHELRNPLHAVRSAITVLESSPGGEDGGNALRVIRRQSDLMSRLVDDLLDVARISAGRLELRRGNVDLAQVACDVAEAMASSFAQKGVRLVCEGVDEPLPMSGDAARLQQVFANLLSNALRHTPEGSEVRVTLRSEGGRVRVTVRDQGRGIEPSDVERIFELFAQGEQGLARQSGGLGLGLTLVRRIVDAHGGVVVGDNREDGPGAVFTVELPLVPSAQAERVVTRTGAGRRIVLVEDQDDARCMMKLLLEMDGHEVFEAQDGPAAVERIEEVQPDVAIVDIGLPGIDGYEVARRVRVKLRDSVRLVALTGYGRPEDIERSVAAGFDQHLTKPLDQEQLRRAMRWLGSRSG